MKYMEQICIYSFDEQGFKKRWASIPKRSPSFRVGQGTVEITYQEEAEKQSPTMTQTLSLIHSGVIAASLVPKS
jgi:hypothetical protein